MCQLLRVVLPAGMRGAHRGLRQLAAAVDAVKPTLRETEVPAVIAARQGVPVTVVARRRCPMRSCCGIERDGQGRPPSLFRPTLQDGMGAQQHLRVAACGRGRRLTAVVVGRGRT